MAMAYTKQYGGVTFWLKYVPHWSGESWKAYDVYSVGLDVVPKEFHNTLERNWKNYLRHGPIYTSKQYPGGRWIITYLEEEKENEFGLVSP